MKKALVLLLVAVAIGIVILKVHARHSPATAREGAAASSVAVAPVSAQPVATAAQPARAQADHRQPVARPAPKPPATSGPAAERPAAALALRVPARPAGAAAAPAPVLLSSTTVTEKPKVAEGAHHSVPAAPAPPETATAVLEKATALLKDSKYVEARAVLNERYLASRGEQAARLRQLLDQVNAELVFNPRCVDGAVVHAVQPKESLTTIAKKYGVNWRTIQVINGMTGDKLRAGQKLKVLPGPASAVVYKGEFRMALLLGGLYVKEYPIGIGKEESETPTGTFVIDQMKEKPPWYKPEGGIVPYGKEGNPLGERWLGFENRSGLASLGIHGTNDEATIRTKCSNGCVRMRNADVVELYEFLHPGSRVEIRD